MILLGYALQSFLIAMLVWAFGAFISMEPNILNWSDAGRFFAVAVWVAGCALFVGNW